MKLKEPQIIVSQAKVCNIKDLTLLCLGILKGSSVYSLNEMNKASPGNRSQVIIYQNDRL